MVVVMQERASEDQIEKVVAHLVALGMDVHRSTGVSRTVLGAVGDDRRLDPRLVELLEGVSEVLRVTEPYKLASRQAGVFPSPAAWPDADSRSNRRASSMMRSKSRVRASPPSGPPMAVACCCTFCSTCDSRSGW